MCSRQASEFNFESAVNRLVNLSFIKNRAVSTHFVTPADDIDIIAPFNGDVHVGGGGQSARQILLAGMIDFESRRSVSDTCPT